MKERIGEFYSMTGFDNHSDRYRNSFGDTSGVPSANGVRPNSSGEPPQNFESESLTANEKPSEKKVFPTEAKFAFLVRTQNRRPQLFIEALESILEQPIPSLPIVLVHADREAFDKTRKLVEEKFGSRCAVHHCPDTDRLRGYPLNEGLMFCYERLPNVEFVAFLDDDDRIYPNFTSAIYREYENSGADVICGASMKRTPADICEHAYSPGSPIKLLTGNFIPINAYAVRLSVARTKGLLYREDLPYLEDWAFLLNLFHSGLRFAPVYEYVSEFRTRHRKEYSINQDPEGWQASAKMIEAQILTSNFHFDGETLRTYTAQLIKELEEDGCRLTLGVPKVHRRHILAVRLIDAFAKLRMMKAPIEREPQPESRSHFN